MQLHDIIAEIFSNIPGVENPLGDEWIFPDGESFWLDPDFTARRAISRAIEIVSHYGYIQGRRDALNDVILFSQKKLGEKVYV